MNKLEMAQEYALKMLENLNPMQMDKPTRDGIAYECFELAEAMLAEDDKRKTKGLQGVLKVADTPQLEWQPDWSQAPNGYDWFAIDKYGDSYFYTYKPYISNGSDIWADAGCMFADGNSKQADSSFNYQGNWQDSLRKRTNT